VSESTAPVVRRLTWNPVLRRELVERWRGRRAFAVLTAYLVVLTLLLLLLLWAGTTVISQQFGPGGADAGPLLGRFLLENLYALVLLLVLFIGPGYAAAQISGERERRTLGLLQITLVSPWRIVIGKLGAAVAWLLLLVLAAAPMGALAFFLGGVTFGQLVRGVLYLVLVAVAVAAMGIGISAIVRKTTAAVVLTYALVLVLVVGTLFAALVEVSIRRFDLDGPPVVLMANPFVGLADAAQAGPSFELPSILTPFAAALPEADQFGRGGFDGPTGWDLDQPADVVFDAPLPIFDRTVDRTPVWLIDAALYLLLGALGLVVATRRVRPGHGPRPRRTAEERAVGAFGTPPPAAGVPLPPGVEPPPPPPPTAPPPPPPPSLGGDA
jgi:ABC-2 type transport system permease protein